MPNDRSSSPPASRTTRFADRPVRSRLIALLSIATLLVVVVVGAGVRNWSSRSGLSGSAPAPAEPATVAGTNDPESATPRPSAEQPAGQPGDQAPIEANVPERSVTAPDDKSVTPTELPSDRIRTKADPVRPDAGSPFEVFLEQGANRPIRSTAGRISRAQPGDSENEGEGRRSTQGQQSREPKEEKLKRAGRSFDGDLRSLPYQKPVKKEKPEREPPPITRGTVGTPTPEEPAPDAAPSAPSEIQAAAPAPIINFDGLDRTNWGNGSPPDTNGDVGPNHYIQSVNTSIGIYNKSTGAPITRFTVDTFMSQGNFGNLCDTDNFGDPVVLYDTFEDRWVITDFAFQLDASDNVINPPGSFQCFAVSKTSDPVSGGWNFFSINTTGGLGDYPKFGIWPDGLYMTTSMFDYAASGGFQNPRAYAFNKAQMYAGAPTVQVISFNLPAGDFTVLPSNARLQTGTPPVGTPNYYVSTWQYLNALSVYKFHVDWNSVSLSTFSAETLSTVATSWPNYTTSITVPQSGTATLLDSLEVRAMMQNQYTNIGGVESLWNTHTIRRTATGFAAPRWYQVPVTGGTIAAATQGATWDPDGANVMHRWMPSLAVDRAGNMALGYSTSSSTTFPSIKYAGRLAGDAVNTFSQTEQLMFAGTASQTTVTRWGDYSTMSLDPDGCTFWFTSEYADPASTTRWRTRIGSFKYPSCTPVGNGGTISGTVTASPGVAAVNGATVTLGSRTATTNASGVYAFSVPAGNYPAMTATAPGMSVGTAANITVADGITATRNFALTSTASSACMIDTTQADFLTGVASSTDVITSPGSVTLSNDAVLNQQNTSLINSGFNFTDTVWYAQTFTPSATGQVSRIDLNLFSLSCSAVSMPNVTVSIRATSGNAPTGADLATATIPGFCNGGGGNYTATFASPATLTSGTVYAIVWRAAAAVPSPGGYYATVSNSNPYAGGRRALSTNSGGAWTGATGNSNNDFGFKVYMKTGFTTSGNFISGAKDANPAAGANPTWGTLSWTGATPAGTTLKFQAAAGSNAAGTFTFVGPDGTANTFFSNGGSLAQFNGSRYLKYKAFFTGTAAASPTLSDVSICFVNQAATSIAAGLAIGTYGGTVNLSATLTSGGSGVSGKTVDFKLNNVSVGSAATNASGVAALSNVTLAGINAGSYASGVFASFGGDGSFQSSTGTNSLNVNQAGQTINFAALADKVLGDAPFTVSATGGASGNPVTFGATGNCTSTGTNGSLITLTAVGGCQVTASQAGSTNYSAAPGVLRSFNITAFDISGTVTYGTTPSGGPVKYISGVTLSSTGSPAVANATSDSGGAYTMSGFGSGAYTVAATKAAQTSNTGISLQDASEVAKYAFNQATPNANQIIAADATGNGLISLQDASEIAKRSFNIASTNVVATWKFVPATRAYSGLLSNQTGKDYTAILIGDVTGNWTAPSGPQQTETEILDTQASPTALAGNSDSPAAGMSADTETPNAPAVNINVSLPTDPSGSYPQTVSIPVTVGSVTGQNITSYEMTVTFDPTILEPATPAYDTTGTLTGTAGFFPFVDPLQPAGSLRVGAFGFAPLSGQGTLIYLKFNVKAGNGAVIPLNFSQFLFGEGGPADPTAVTTNGQFTRLGPTGADVSIGGQVVSAYGYGIYGATVVVSGTGTGSRAFGTTGPFGYFRIDGLDAGQSYVVTITSKTYTFPQSNRVITLNDSVDDLVFVANP